MAKSHRLPGRAALPHNAAVLRFAGVSMLSGQVGRFPLLAPLRGRDFALLWSGNAISLAGDQFQAVALAVMTLDLTGSTAVLGAVLGVQAVPRALLMLLGGVAADRYRPRTVMLAANALEGVLVTLLAADIWAGRLAIWHLYVYGVCSGAVLAFSVPAATTFVPFVVPQEHRRSANALNSLNVNLASAVYPPLAGVLVAALGSLPAFALNAASFFAAAGLVRGIRVLGTPTRSGASALHQLREGLVAARSERVVWVAIVAGAIYSLGSGGATLVGVPALGKLSLQAGSEGGGLLFGAVGAGAVVGTIITGSLAGMRRQGLVAGATLTGCGVALALVAAAPTLREAVPLMAMAGLLRGAMANIYVTLVQSRAPEAARGRVIALFMLGVFGLSPLSFGIGGAVGAVVGPRALLALGGGCVALAGVYSLAHRAFREAD